MALAAESLARAVELVRTEQLGEADALLGEILAAEPGNADALHYLGVLRHAQGRNDEGIELIRQSLHGHPDNTGAWNNLGNLLLHAQRVDEATQAYRASVAHAAPGDDVADALNNISTLQRKQSLWNEAEASARHAIEMRPDFGDAWYNLSLALMGQRRVREGLLANSRAVTLWPRQSQSRGQVIRALQLLGEDSEAARLYRDWLDEDPGNPVVRHMLSAYEGEPPVRASDDYVRTVFDAYAGSFDASLEKLHYCAPELVSSALARRAGEPKMQLAIVDAGCGTGLCGPLLRPWASRLAGCDLSVGMLRRARPRGVYDVLHMAELTYYLRTQPTSFDVVVSADTLCYFGDLHDALDAAAGSLKAGGHLIFTVEATAPGVAAPFLLQTNGRYAHGERHLRECLQAAALERVEVEPVVPRAEGGVDVRGWLVAATKASLEASGSPR